MPPWTSPTRPSWAPPVCVADLMLERVYRAGATAVMNANGHRCRSCASFPVGRHIAHAWGDVTQSGACVGSMDGQPVPGRVPWLQDEPVAAQVYARHISSIRRQLQCVRGAIGLRCHHEIPGLLRGRRRRIENLQAAIAQPLATALPGTLAVLRRALDAEQSRLECDTALLQPFANATNLPPPPAVELLEEGDENLFISEQPEPGSLAADFAADKAVAQAEACEPLIADEASLADAPPLNLLPGVMHGEAGQAPQDILAIHCAYPQPNCITVETLEEACSDVLPGEQAIVKLTVGGVSEVLTRDDFLSLLPGSWLTTGPINFQSIMLQVLLRKCSCS